MLLAYIVKNLKIQPVLPDLPIFREFSRFCLRYSSGSHDFLLLLLFPKSIYHFPLERLTRSRVLTFWKQICFVHLTISQTSYYFEASGLACQDGKPVQWQTLSFAIHGTHKAKTAAVHVKDLTDSCYKVD